MSKYITVNGIRIAKEFIPETSGRLTTIGPRFSVSTGKGKYGRRTLQVCQCVCGSICVTDSHVIKSGVTKSCGCLQKELVTIHSTKHGKRKLKEYNSWDGMRQRCSNPKNPKYAYYGGRGITVCARWLDPENGFTNFLADMGERPSDKHSIDRYPDNNGNYCPENCRWATKAEQMRNTRGNRLLTYNGKTQCLTEWAKETKLPFYVLHSRLNKLGHSVEKALTTPYKKQKDYENPA